MLFARSQTQLQEVHDNVQRLTLWTSSHSSVKKSPWEMESRGIYREQGVQEGDLKEL